MDPTVCPATTTITTTTTTTSTTTTTTTTNSDVMKICQYMATDKGGGPFRIWVTLTWPLSSKQDIYPEEHSAETLH